MSNHTDPKDQKTRRGTADILIVRDSTQPAPKEALFAARRARMAYDKVTLFDPFHFSDPNSPCQRKLDYGLSFTLEPRENIDPFQYVYSLAHEPAVLCMFFCKKVRLSVVYKLIKHESDHETHTVECMPIKVIEGAVRPRQAGNIFTRDEHGFWRDVFTKVKIEGPIADSIKVTETHYDSLDPLQWRPSTARTKPRDTGDGLAESEPFLTYKPL